jgi:hypothetical protein
MYQAIPNLVRGKRDIVPREARCGPAHLLSVEVTYAYRTDFACLNGLRHQVHQFLNAQQGVRKMDVVQVDPLYAQAVQAVIKRVHELAAC